jgi:polysaccharide deacetylase
MSIDVSNAIIRMRNRYRRSLSTLVSRRLVRLRTRFPIISFTFDDFPQSAWRNGGAILRKHGLAGTYYASLGLMGRQIPAGPGFSGEDLRQLVAEGHDLGCHTFAHCHAWETRPGDFEESIIENSLALAKLVPGAAFKTLSYPIDYPRPQTKRRAARYFACCRGGGQISNVGTMDLNCLKAFFLEKGRDDPESVKGLILQNCRAHGWLIFATHDICEDPTLYGCTPGFFEEIVRFAINSGSKVLPVAKALEMVCVDHF